MRVSGTNSSKAKFRAPQCSASQAIPPSPLSDHKSLTSSFTTNRPAGGPGKAQFVCSGQARRRKAPGWAARNRRCCWAERRPCTAAAARPTSCERGAWRPSSTPCCCSRAPRRSCARQPACCGAQRCLMQPICCRLCNCTLHLSMHWWVTLLSRFSFMATLIRVSWRFCLELTYIVLVSPVDSGLCLPISPSTHKSDKPWNVIYVLETSDK